MMTLVAASMSLSSEGLRQAALAEIPPYESRGKGKAETVVQPVRRWLESVRLASPATCVATARHAAANNPQL